jgi:hypothetical protein
VALCWHRIEADALALGSSLANLARISLRDEPFGKVVRALARTPRKRHNVNLW